MHEITVTMDVDLEEMISEKADDMGVYEGVLEDVMQGIIKHTLHAVTQEVQACLEIDGHDWAADCIEEMLSDYVDD